MWAHITMAMHAFFSFSATTSIIRSISVLQKLVQQSRFVEKYDTAHSELARPYNINQKVTRASKNFHSNNGVRTSIRSEMFYFIYFRICSKGVL